MNQRRRDVGQVRKMYFYFIEHAPTSVQKQVTGDQSLGTAAASNIPEARPMCI
jgi:hypothetical protein